MLRHAVGVASACPELIGDMRDLGPLREILAPALKILFGAPIDMERGGHARACELGLHQRNTLHRMEVVPPRNMGVQAVVRRRHQRHAEYAKVRDRLRASRRAVAPPPLERGVLVSAGQNDLDVGCKTIGVAQSEPRTVLRSAGALVEKGVERERYRAAVHATLPPPFMVEDGYERRERGAAHLRRARSGAEFEPINLAHLLGIARDVPAADLGAARRIAAAQRKAIELLAQRMEATALPILRADRAAHRRRKPRMITVAVQPAGQPCADGLGAIGARRQHRVTSMVPAKPCTSCTSAVAIPQESCTACMMLAGVSATIATTLRSRVRTS